MRGIIASAAVLFACLCASGAAFGAAVRSLDGSGNNVQYPDWGAANTQYLRIRAASYTDGVGGMRSDPAPRWVSNRIFNDVGQNLFSENDVSQWGWAWGQFMDHDFGLRDETRAESVPIPFSTADPLETFRNDFGAIDFARTPAAPGTGVTTPRQQINTLSSYIDGSGVYGVTNDRLDWLRVGTVDGDPTNNAARLLLPNDYLPSMTDRTEPAPAMDLMGPLVGHPERARVAGDVRANENIALTAIHTLFAREHNRIVSLLPRTLTAEERFQIARREVGAELQYITYNEFLPALGVVLTPYRGYDPSVNPGLSNEFATVGYRAHSMIHGEFETTRPVGTWTDTQLAAFHDLGITVEPTATSVTLVIPLSVAFGRPALVERIGLGPVLESLGEHEYRNDEQIDNTLRSVLFQVPKPGIPDPTVCGAPVVNPDCFQGVSDLGAIDIQRGRDHGMPSYNDMRVAYGLAPKTSLAAVTGESTQAVPPTDTLANLDFVQLYDLAGNAIPLGSPDAQEAAVVGVRRTTLASRLKQVYGGVGKLDAFVGMVSEQHVAGTEFGELQLAIWKKQFEAVRDGDRFFYANDPALRDIKQRFGLDPHYTLAEIIRLNSDATVPDDVFHAA